MSHHVHSVSTVGDSLLLLVSLVRKFYNNPQNIGLISKKFPLGRKYAILEQYCNVLIFRLLVFLCKIPDPKCVTINPFWVAN